MLPIALLPRFPTPYGAVGNIRQVCRSSGCATRYLTLIPDQPYIFHDWGAAKRAVAGLLPEYAAVLLEEAAHTAPTGEKNHSLEEFEKALDRIAQFSQKIPVLPDEAFSRESLYQDHD